MSTLKFFRRSSFNTLLAMFVVLICCIIGSWFVSSGMALAATNSIPTIPKSLKANSITSSSVRLSWSASSSSRGIKYYTVYRNGKKIATTTKLTYRNTALQPLTTYSYTVSATSYGLKISGQSSPLSITTLAAPPLSLVVTQVESTRVTLEWTASQDAAKLAGYYVYRNGDLFASVSNNVTSYTDDIASPQTTYQYFIKGYYAATTTQPTKTITVSTPAVTPPARIPASGTPLGGCAEITTPGAYYLTSDVSGIASATCFNIHDTTDVTFNCDDHAITSAARVVLSISNVTGFVLTNCTISTRTVEIDSSANGIVQANSFVDGAVVNTQTGQGITVQFNNFSDGVYQAHSETDNYVGFNTFGWLGTVGAASIISSAGNNNTIEYNDITADGSQDTTQQGMDDGIVLQDESTDIVRANSVSNVWDCGIETLGLISNSTITGNKITKAYRCGLGGWYWNSWHGNVVTNNTFDSTRYMFWFYRLYGLRANEQSIYFDDNTFAYNVLTNPADNHSPQSWFNLQDLPDIPAAQVVVGNNLFSNNNFGKVGYPPYINPALTAVDGGGNVCSTLPPVVGTSVLRCR